MAIKKNICTLNAELLEIYLGFFSEPIDNFNESIVLSTVL